MTPDNIDTEALRALEAKATPGPWTVVNVCGDTEVHAGSKSLSGDTQYYPWTFDIEDTRLIVALRNAAPALLAAHEAQRKEIELLVQQANYAIGANADSKGKLDAVAAERDALKAEVERLRAALKKAESVADAGQRYLTYEYLPWAEAGGPMECKHGFCAVVLCRECDAEKLRSWKNPEAERSALRGEEAPRE